jgi:hypothetical protein
VDLVNAVRILIVYLADLKQVSQAYADQTVAKMMYNHNTNATTLHKLYSSKQPLFSFSYQDDCCLSQAQRKSCHYSAPVLRSFRRFCFEVMMVC